ncbi:UNC93-like protein MFSD11 isoform X2 [Ptychodera flava]|uniref:UNC93-like protein MFSD11 isoform X2 n=1 Tax=Ptychodera flava TaxID=63121 RepID=UPI003969F6C6
MTKKPSRAEERTVNMACDIRLVNVIILGFAFMFLFTAFQTCSMIEQTVLNSVINETEHSNSSHNFTGSGYTSLSIIYAVFATSNWIAPSVVSVIGPKWSMVAGGVTYALFIAGFLKPTEWILYTTSVLVGIGAAVIWTGQGNFLTINSDTETIGRNSGIFWALLQCSLLFGNLFVYFEFQGQTNIQVHTRTTVFIVLLVVACIGILMFLLLRNKRSTDSDDLLTINVGSGDEKKKEGPVQAFKRAFQLLKTREIILLSVCFAYTGFELTFFSGVYGTCIGNTSQLENSKSLIGLSGMLIGIGEIIGGASFGLFGKRTIRFGRDPIVLLGYFVHMTCFYLIFYNIPVDAPLKSVNDQAYMEPNEVVALLCAFMLGFGDSCFNTQIYSILGFMFPEDSAPAFALFKFVQSTCAAAAFFYSLYLTLQWQLLILVIFGTAGSLCFFVGVESQPSGQGRLHANLKAARLCQNFRTRSAGGSGQIGRTGTTAL